MKTIPVKLMQVIKKAVSEVGVQAVGRICTETFEQAGYTSCL